MTIEEVLPRLGEGVALRCSVSPGRGGGYVVPVEHRRLGRLSEGSRRLLEGLPAGGSFEQLRCILEAGPLGLFAPRLRPLVKPPRVEGQGTWGAILVLPPTEWKAARRELAGWQFEGVEAAFGGLPYAFEDVLVFAALNFSPDCSFTVLKGPMAGKVFWWGHDGEADLAEPWAEDVRGWARRVWEEVPEVFGGIIRFESGDCVGTVEEGVELYPEKLIAWAG